MRSWRRLQRKKIPGMHRTISLEAVLTASTIDRISSIVGASSPDAPMARIEAKIAKNKDLYYDALNRAQHGWHEGTEDAVPFIKYLLGTILAAYKDFGDRFAIVEEKLPAIDMVRKAALNKIGRFTKQDIREQCPSLSLSSVEAALRKMVASGELKREGTGKSTCYIRLK